ncbi:Major capsid protein precursor [Escherichia coli O25b:H4]|uniref:Major capsid protein n=1 Tax=Escherichia coli O25b:H4 TaxID=941280 RepID=A0A192CNE5_ECO25|nr:Major capsid protein precursor [Escherichia coli O25b:H4]
MLAAPLPEPLIPPRKSVNLSDPTLMVDVEYKCEQTNF